MTKRREFTRPVKVAIIKRATRDGVTYCEACGLPARKWDIDHTKPDGLEIDKSRPLTADDGQLLCAGSRETCHGRKTAEQDVPAIAKAKRREAVHLGVRKDPTIRSAGFARPAPKDRTSTKLARGGSAIARQYGMGEI